MRRKKIHESFCLDFSLRNCV